MGSGCLEPSDSALDVPLFPSAIKFWSQQPLKKQVCLLGHGTFFMLNKIWGVKELIQRSLFKSGDRNEYSVLICQQVLEKLYLAPLNFVILCSVHFTAANSWILIRLPCPCVSTMTFTAGLDRVAWKCFEKYLPVNWLSDDFYNIFFVYQWNSIRVNQPFLCIHSIKTKTCLCLSHSVMPLSFFKIWHFILSLTQ